MFATRGINIDVIDEVKVFYIIFDMKDLREPNVILNIKSIKDDSRIEISLCWEDLKSVWLYRQQASFDTPNVTLWKNKKETSSFIRHDLYFILIMKLPNFQQKGAFVGTNVASRRYH